MIRVLLFLSVIPCGGLKVTLSVKPYHQSEIPAVANSPRNAFPKTACVNRAHRRFATTTLIRSRTRKSALTWRTIS
jgi:hypothetical protein